jgi:hypothetical protein
MTPEKFTDWSERVVLSGRVTPPSTVSLITVRCLTVPDRPGSSAGAVQVLKVS